MSELNGAPYYLLEPNAPVIVVPMRYQNIPRAATVYEVAFKRDPLHRYIRNEREPNHIQKFAGRLYISVYLIGCIRNKIALTINAGTANVTASPPSVNGVPGHDPLTRIIEWVRKVILAGIRKLVTNPISRKRRKEVEEALEKASKRTFGDRLDKMWYVEALWTDPASQGHGYGGAVLDSVTILADLAGETIWLQSSNIANTSFYNEHGFETVETIVFGDQDPTWHNKPVVVSIMVREPRWPPASQ